jgi:PEP-CTERM motif-containing protein
MMSRAALALALTLLFSSRALAVVVGGTNIVFAGPFDNGLLGNYTATVYQDVARTNPTSVWLNFDGANLGITATNIDEGSDWYFVHPGDQFGTATIAAGQFQAVLPYNVNTVPPFRGSFVGEGDFILGVSTGLGFTNGTPNRNEFGWITIHNDNGVLEGFDNAISYDSPGIIVGTLTEVPEPTSLVLIALGGLGLIRLRRPRPVHVVSSQTFV